MDNADQKLESGTKPFYDLIRRPLSGLYLTKSYTELLTGSMTLLSICTFLKTTIPEK